MHFSPSKLSQITSPVLGQTVINPIRTSFCLSRLCSSTRHIRRGGVKRSVSSKDPSASTYLKCRYSLSRSWIWRLTLQRCTCVIALSWMEYFYYHLLSWAQQFPLVRLCRPYSPGTTIWKRYCLLRQENDDCTPYFFRCTSRLWVGIDATRKLRLM